MAVPVIVEEHAGIERAQEPVALGLPLTRGAARSVDSLRLLDEEGLALPAQQITQQTRWSDGSLKWVFVEALLDAKAGDRRALSLATIDKAEDSATPLVIEESPAEVQVITGPLEATIPRTGARLISSLCLDQQPLLREPEGLTLRLLDERREGHDLRVTSVDVTARGPLRCGVVIRGRLGRHLEVTARLSLWAGRELIRLDVTLRNPQAAHHEGGTWDLGDPASVLIADLGLLAQVVGADRAQRGLRWGSQRGEALSEASSVERFDIYQDSSGGERWDFKTHLTRDLVVPQVFRGYRVRGDEVTLAQGERAEPSLWLSGESGVSLGATVRDFWQNFPKSLEASGDRLKVGLFPGEFGALHELQGGEQKTHTIWLSAGAPNDLGWVQAPLVVRSTPTHYASSGVFPGLLERSRDGNAPMLEQVDLAIDESEGLIARREVIDEYGWRNFGEVWADHENIGNDDPTPRVSHYNNQYDGIYSALVQFARSGDPRWFRFGDELARHVADIDIYHTAKDRSAFSGGLFWHTDHYTDAVTATHRCYTGRCPQAEGGSYGGGPAAEHDYATGLATHYLMTGWSPSREGALSLGDWVVDVDEPEDLLGGWLRLPGPSGLATRTDDHSFHGPGRGAGNSIETLLDALELTDNERYLRKAEELIRRVVHPDDDREGFELLSNPEVRWSYLVMLLAVLRFLEVKAERGELDDEYGYAQATVLSYGRWMMKHETLSSKKRDLLEIWTESWPAQDLRKGLILMQLGRHLSDDAECAAFRARGRELFLDAQTELLEWETATLARPLFLVMRYGYLGSFWMQRDDLEPLPQVVSKGHGRPSGFIPWKGKPKALKRALEQALSALRRR